MALSTKGYVWKSEFARTHRAEGRAEGRDEGRRLAMLAVLEGRGLSVTEAQRETIMAPVSGERLAGWLRRSGVVETVAELLDDGDA